MSLTIGKTSASKLDGWRTRCFREASWSRRRHGNKAVTRTAALMADRSVPAIFEAAFEHSGVRIRVDILERLLRGYWGLREAVTW